MYKYIYICAYIYILQLLLLLLFIIVIILVVIINNNIILYMHIYISHITYPISSRKCLVVNVQCVMLTPPALGPLGAPPLVGLVPPAAQRAVALGAFPATATCPVVEARRK